MPPGHSPLGHPHWGRAGIQPPAVLGHPGLNPPVASRHPQGLLPQPDGPLGPPPSGLAGLGGSRHPSNRICSVMEESAFALLGGETGCRWGC